MQRVCQIVDGDAKHLRPLNPKVIKRSTSARACKSVARKARDQLFSSEPQDDGRVETIHENLLFGGGLSIVKVGRP